MNEVAECSNLDTLFPYVRLFLESAVLETEKYIACYSLFVFVC